MKAIMFIVVEASVAAGGPTGVAYQIHQIVRAFHSAKVSAAQPKTFHHERREASYEALTHSSGTNPARSVSPVMLSHPGESRRAERITAASLRNMEGDFMTAKVLKRAHFSKYFLLLS